MKKIFVLSVFVLLSGSVAFAVPLESLLSGDLISKLRAEGELSRNVFGSTELAYTPEWGALLDTLFTNIGEIEPDIVSESLELWKKPAGGQHDWTAAERTALFNRITAISTLEGLEYFSYRRQKMRTLYADSYVIDNPKDKTEQSDPYFSTPPRDYSMYAYQRDLSFGRNTYFYNYHTENDRFLITLRNETTMAYSSIITAVKAGNFRSTITIFDTGDSILIYVATLVKAATLPGFLKDHITESINNRSEALVGWFAKKAEEAYK
jgi:hypothetical protein